MKYLDRHTFLKKENDKLTLLCIINVDKVWLGWDDIHVFQERLYPCLWSNPFVNINASERTIMENHLCVIKSRVSWFRFYYSYAYYFRYKKWYDTWACCWKIQFLKLYKYAFDFEPTVSSTYTYGVVKSLIMRMKFHECDFSVLGLLGGERDLKMYENMFVTYWQEV